MAQTWVLFTGSLEQIGSAVTVLDVGGMNDDHQQKPEDVGHNMTLAPFGLFASVIAANASAFRYLCLSRAATTSRTGFADIDRVRDFTDGSDKIDLQDFNFASASEYWPMGGKSFGKARHWHPVDPM